MTITLHWDEDHPHIIWQVFEGNWTLEDYVESYKEFGKILDTCDFTVYVMCDMRQAGTPPVRLLSIARHVESKLPDNRGSVVIIGGPTFLNLILKIGAQIMPKYTSGLYPVDTVEEGYSILLADMKKEQEDTLNK